VIGETISGGVVVLEAGAILGGRIDFASGGTLEILGTTMPTAPISGFGPGDTIDLASVAFDSGGSAQLASGNALQVVESGQTYQLNFDPAQDFTDRQFVLSSDGNGGTDVTLVHVYFSTIVTSGEVLNVSSAQPLDTLDFVLSGGVLNVLSSGVVSGSTVSSGGIETVSSGGTDVGTSFISGQENIESGGVASGAIVWTGGVQAGGAAGETDSGTDRGVFFSGGGVVQLDALLSQFAGVISGFDLGSELDLRSLRFGSSPGAASWMPQAPNGPASADGGGHIFNLTLLGQYAANFSAGADGHGGGMVTDPPSAASVMGTPTSMTVAHS
jgi:autotransporter passenger strand-loop-strand repeat protein